jgi:hypothetical protein
MSSGVGIGASFVFYQRPGGAGGFVVDKGWNFDGVDEYIPFQNGKNQIIQPSQGEINGDGFSFSIWVRPTRTNYDLPIWANNNSGVNANLQAGLTLNIHNSNRIIVQMGGATGTTSTARKSGLSDQTIPVNQWTHLCCTWNGDANGTSPSWSLWINGQPSALAFTSNPYGTTFNPGGFNGNVSYSNLDGASPLVARSGSFGCNKSGTRFFEGQMTEGVAYNTVITNDIALAIYNVGSPINPLINSGDYTIASNIVAYWTTKNTPTWQENFYTWRENSQINKQSAYALHLDEASSQYYLLGNGLGTTASLGIFNVNFSVTGWIVPSSNTGSMSVVQSGDGLSGYGFLIYRNGSNLIFRVSYNGTAYDQISRSVFQEEWNFFCATYNQSTKELTLETGAVGSPIGSRTSVIGVDPIDNTGGPFALCIGNRVPNGSIPFDGWVDDFGFYNQVLTSPQADELFARSKNPQSLNAGCTGWFKFGDDLSYPSSAYSDNWYLDNAVADDDINRIVTESGIEVTAEDGTQLIVEHSLDNYNMIGTNTVFYDRINGDMSTLPLLPSISGPTTPNLPSATPDSECNAWTVNMEEGDLVNISIP